jgi:hypothetical protein
MGPNVAVLHVDDSNFASGLLNFKAAFKKKQQVKKIMK